MFIHLVCRAEFSDIMIIMNVINKLLEVVKRIQNFPLMFNKYEEWNIAHIVPLPVSYSLHSFASYKTKQEMCCRLGPLSNLFKRRRRRLLLCISVPIEGKDLRYNNIYKIMKIYVTARKINLHRETYIYSESAWWALFNGAIVTVG